MVDYIKRARNTGDIDSDEEVIGACNCTPSPFSMTNAGATGGLIAGGLPGLAIGAAWDRYQAKRESAEAADEELPSIVTRTEFEPGLPANGALVAITTKRLVGWAVSGFGKPRDVAVTLPLSEIDQVLWDEQGQQLLRGKPSTTVFWLGLAGDRVLPMAAISGGPNHKHVQNVVQALAERLPGKVRRFEPT